jgi:hypothetical protein
MRFKQYLTEQNISMDKIDSFLNKELDKINDLIQNDCKHYLRLIKNIKTPFYRGVHNVNTYGTKKTRNIRRSMGTSSKEFDYVNKWLDDNGHNNRTNNVVITTSNILRSIMFGNNCYIFPTGKISYTWMDAEDFNLNNPETGWYSWIMKDYIRSVDYDFNNPKDNVSMEEYESTYKTGMKKPFADYFHTDKGIDIAYKNGYEIWFKCKSYIYIHTKWLDQMNWKWSNGQFWQM